MTDPTARADAVTPALRVVRGHPDADEVAAVTAVIAAVVATSRPRARPVRVWAAPGRSIPAPLRPGPGAWVSSARG